jgi:ABC-type branched-subunit amino acid transport system substrate-binding protein
VFLFLPAGEQGIAFMKGYAGVNGDKLRPNFMAAAGYDGMAAIYEALKKTNGATDRVSGANQSRLRRAVLDGTIAAETVSAVVDGTP